MRTLKVALLLAVSIALTSIASAAAVPPLMNYQGVLKDVAGQVVPDGNYSVTFRIWDAETGGAAIWQEGRLIAVQVGLFTVLLGSIAPIPDSIFRSPDRWIGLQIGLDPEMTPRSRLVSVPYSWQSHSAKLADTAVFAHSVDTSGFSAYQDLLSEGRIGLNAGQLAPGDQVHPLVSGMFRVEDTASVQLTTSVPGTYVLKDISIPAGEIGHYLRIVVSGKGTQLGGGSPSWGLQLFVNGVMVWGSSGTQTGDYRFVTAIELSYFKGNRWSSIVSTSEGNSGSVGDVVGLTSFGPFSVQLRVIKNDSANMTYESGDLIVVYDKD